MIDDHGEFIGKRGIVGTAIGNCRRDHMAGSVLVLQPFAAERCSPGGRAKKKPARTLISCGPDQVTDSLESEHGIENVKRQHRDAMDAVGSRGGDPGRQCTRLGDPLFKQLAVFASL